MRTKHFRLLGVVLAIGLFFQATGGFAQQWDLVIIATSDTKGILEPYDVKVKKGNEFEMQSIGGISRLAWLVSRAKEKFPNKVLMVSAGDDLMGPYFFQLSGKPILAAMEKIGYTAITYGNHPFDRGDAFLANSVGFAPFPVVISNLEIAPQSPLHGHIKAYTIVEVNAIKIGIFGLIEPDLSLVSSPGPNIKVQTDVIAVSREMVRTLREKENVDVVLALCHLDPRQSELLSLQVDGIDIGIIGNGTDVTKQGEEVIQHANGRSSLWVMPGTNLAYAGILKLAFKDNHILAHQWQGIALDAEIPEDPDMRQFVQTWASQLPESTELSQLLVPLDLRKAFVRTRETPIGNLMCDMMRERFKTDIAMTNGGGIRGDQVLSPGPITNKDVEMIDPWKSTITVLKVSGTLIKRILEHSVALLPNSFGGFLQVSGVRFVVDLHKPAEELSLDKDGNPVAVVKPGQRVQKVEVLGQDGTFQPLEPDKIYSLAIGTWISKGGDGYAMLKDVQDRKDTDVELQNIMTLGLQARKTVSPQTEGRIRIVSQ